MKILAVSDYIDKDLTRQVEDKTLTPVDLIIKHTPDYFVHGHIHQEFETAGERITQFHTTQVINTCGYTIIEA